MIAKFKQIDVDDRGSLDRQVVVKEVQQLENASYDQVRETLKDVSLDASGRVELEDYVDVCIRDLINVSSCLAFARVATLRLVWFPRAKSL